MISVRPLLNFPLVTKAEDEWVDSPFPHMDEHKEEDGDDFSDSGSDSCSDSGSEDEGSDVSEVGFYPTFEKPGDAIPRQSVFVAQSLHLIRAADAVEEVARGQAIMKFLTFLLRFEHAPFHRAYPLWRKAANEKCASFLEEAEEPELRSLCHIFMTKFPL